MKSHALDWSVLTQPRLAGFGVTGDRNASSGANSVASDVINCVAMLC
jgi:hypothetical protein